MTTVIIPTKTIKLHGAQTAHYARLIQHIIQFEYNSNFKNYIDRKILVWWEYEFLQDIFLHIEIDESDFSIYQLQEWLLSIDIERHVAEQNYFINDERYLDLGDNIVQYEINQQLYWKKYKTVQPVNRISAQKVLQYYQEVIVNFDNWLVDWISQNTFKPKIDTNPFEQINTFNTKIDWILYHTIALHHNWNEYNYIIALIIRTILRSWVTFQNRYISRKVYDNWEFLLLLHSQHLTVSYYDQHTDLIKTISKQFVDEFIAMVVHTDRLSSNIDPILLSISQKWCSSDLELETTLTFIATFNRYEYLVNLFAHENSH